MKKIVIPVFVAAGILFCAWIAGATRNPPVRPPKTPPNVPVIINHNPQTPITVSNGSLTMSVSSSNENVLQSSGGEFFLLLDLKAAEAAAAQEDRGPLNIGLVIDHSGSMAEKGKLEYAIQAANSLVDRLNKNDRIAVVVYDDLVEVLVPSTKVTNRQEIKNKISSLQPGRSTNLAGGLATGVAEIQRHFDHEAVNQVIILSDGLANVGLTDRNEIAKLCSQWGEQGVRVTSMGLGADFNEDLMMALANSSGGHYYFIESPTQTAGIYEKEMNTLIQTVAKDVKVNLKLADGVRFDRVYGYNVSADGQNVEIPLGTFTGGEHRKITLRVIVPTNKPGNVAVADVGLNYRDALKDSKTIKDTVAINVACVMDVALVEKKRNTDVEADSVFQYGADQNQKALDLIQSGKKDEAAKLYNETINNIKQKNAAYNSPRLEEQSKVYERQLHDLKTAPSVSTPEGQSNFVKRNKETQRNQAMGYIR